MSAHGYRRPAVLDRVDHRRHSVMEASAGTGKTYTLEHLILELVIRGGLDVEQLVVVTYTEKAAREMRTRVRGTLESVLRAGPGDDAFVAVPDASCWTLDPDTRARLTEQLHRFDAAPISTIHAFCQRILTEHAFENGRMFQQEQVDARTVFGTCFRRQLRLTLADGHVLQPVLHALLRRLRVERLEEQAWSLFERRGELLPRATLEDVQGALMRLPSKAQWAGIKTALSRMDKPGRLVSDAAEKLVVAADVLRKPIGMAGALAALFQVTDGQNDWYAVNVSDACDALDGRMPAHQMFLRDVSLLMRASDPLVLLAHALLPPVREAVAAHKDQAGLLDFDDMLRSVRDGLRRSPTLVAALRRRFRVALVDEFQDTDEIQWDIFRTLFVSPDAPEHRLHLIGDPKQAIFAFRNADVHTYLRASREMVEEQGATRVALTENQRSTPNMVAAYNHIFQEGFFTGANSYSHPVVAARQDWEAVDGRGNPVAPLVALRLWNAEGKPGLDDIRHAVARAVAQECRRVLGSPVVQLRKGDEVVPLQARDIHVLVGTAAEGLLVADELRTAGVPVSYFKQDGLWQTAEAQDVRTVLAALAHGAGLSERLRAWLTPFFSVDVEDLPLARALESQEHPLHRRLNDWRDLARARRWPALFASMLEKSGLARRQLFLRQSERQLTNYQHIMELLVAESLAGQADVSALLARVDAFVDGRAQPHGENTNTQRLDTEEDAVSVLTIHKAKGLEATVVFLAGGFSSGAWQTFGSFHNDNDERCTWLTRGRPESVSKRINAEKEQETQRLAYVALTRPRARLYIPYMGAAAGNLGLPPSPIRAPTLEPKHPFKGPLAPINRRLESLFNAGAHRGDTPLVAVVGLQVDAHPAAPLRSLPAPSGTALSPLPPPRVDDNAFHASRRAHAGFTVTHYTRLKKDLDGLTGAQRGVDVQELLAEFVEQRPQDPPPDGLPGGAATGVFLHGLLEDVPFESALEAPDADAWMQRPEVRALAVEHAARNGVEPRFIDAGLAMVHTTLVAPVRLGDLQLERGFCSLKDRAAELKLLFPIPEHLHLRADTDRWYVERGLIRGVVDLVFRMGDRTYFVDWKSDRLADASPAALKDHVNRQYRMQVVLYTLGISRMLGVQDAHAFEERFGGLCYAFLRNMRPGDPHAGIHFERPTWDDVQHWEDVLRTREPPWPELWRAEGA